MLAEWVVFPFLPSSDESRWSAKQSQFISVNLLVYRLIKTNEHSLDFFVILPHERVWVSFSSFSNK